MNIGVLVQAAIEAAVSSSNVRYSVGAAAIRGDGSLVASSNGNTFGTSIPESHAEIRLIKKLDSRSVVCVVRVKADGSLGMAKPCKNCMRALKARHVSHVYYSTDSGTIEKSDIDPNTCMRSRMFESQRCG